MGSQSLAVYTTTRPADVTSDGKSIQILRPRALFGDSWQPDGRHCAAKESINQSISLDWRI